ncbi:MAG: DNA-binding protein [Duncaniella sp.]|nr:DNA-binding protein [Duncaniella sp.]
MNDLTVSSIERQNVLNNNYALQAIQENLNVNGLSFHNQMLFTTKMVAEFYGVDERTIKRYVHEHGEELRANGYFLSTGNSLKELKLHFVGDINVPKFTRQLGVFSFRAFLNIGMLLTESQKAKQLRSRILDIVIATINSRAGGGTKYINWRDRDYLPTAIKSENYRKNFTQAVGKYVDGTPNYKYEQITDLIYKAVFKENAKEYREVLRLQNEENVRHTLYAEVLLCISAFENGVAHQIEKRYSENGNKQLTIEEVKTIIDDLAAAPMMEPFIHDARTKMASRDVAFRDAWHDNLTEYLRAVTSDEFDKFIGDASINFDNILEANREVLKRLKQADDDE